MLLPCTNSLALPCHSTFPDEAQHVLSNPSPCWCRCYGVYQLKPPHVVRIAHPLSRRYLREPKLLELIMIAYSRFEVPPALPPANTLSVGHIL